MVYQLYCTIYRMLNFQCTMSVHVVYVMYSCIVVQLQSQSIQVTYLLQYWCGIQCTLYSICCIVYTVQCIHCIQCTPYIAITTRVDVSHVLPRSSYSPTVTSHPDYVRHKLFVPGYMSYYYLDRVVCAGICSPLLHLPRCMYLDI